MESIGVITVFVFIAVLLAGAALAGGVVAKWEVRKTKEEIDVTMREIRKQILEGPDAQH